MCGIAGHSWWSEDEGVITAMMAAIAHRGPDASGRVYDHEAHLGHVRLSIIDLGGGHQPMSCDQDRYWITYNGELFNYIELRQELKALGRNFPTESDTEVVLQAYAQWGSSCLPRFNGQFAFGIWDRLEKNWFLARDPFGERPLFITRRGKAFAFASEIKAFLALPGFQPELSGPDLAQVAHTWTTLPHRSCFKGVEQLPPGTSMVVSSNHREAPLPYYSLPPLGNDNTDPKTIAEGMLESVRLRLRSDVEVGTYLSGGLDSTIVTALARELSPEVVHTFSVAFSDPDYDEAEEQHMAQNAFGTQHHELKIDNANIAELFPRVTWHGETAQFRTAAAPLYGLAQRVRQGGLKLVLTGEGADEFFLGYNIYKEVLFRSLLPELGDDEAASILASLYPYLPHFNEANARRQLAMYRRRTNLDSPFASHDMRWANGLWVKSFLLDDQNPDPMEHYGNLPGFTEADPLLRAQEIERFSLLQGYLLSTQGDRMSMAHGVETRTPFLDPTIVSMAQNCALKRKLPDRGGEKQILRDAFAGRLPESLLQRPKQPYRAMEAQAFIQSNEAWVEELTSEKALSDNGLFDAHRVAQLLDGLKKRPERISPRENQAVVFILSTQLLLHQFISGHRPPSNHLEEGLVVDLRRSDPIHP